MKLNRLFAFLIAFLLTGIVMTGVVGIIGTMRLGNMLETVVDKDLTRFLLVTDVRKNIRSQLVLTKDYILAADDAERSKIQEGLAKAKKESLSKLSDYEALISESEKKSLNELRESYKSVLVDEQLVIEKVAGDDRTNAALISKRKKGNPTWEDAIKSLINQADSQLQGEISSAKSFKQTAGYAIGTTLIGALCLGILVGGMIYRRISKNIDTMLKLQEDLKSANEHLEKKVEERTKAINRILSNVKSGFFLVGKDLKVQEGFTKSCKILFDRELSAGVHIADVLQMQVRDREHFIGCLSQVFEDFLPEEVSLGQTPQIFMIGDKALKLEGSVIRSSDQSITEILFTITDVSKLIETEKEIHLSKAIIKILQERESFARFIIDTRKSFEDGQILARQVDDKKLRMILHTVKGNCSAFGLSMIASHIHEVEDQQTISVTDLDAIESQIKTFLQKNATILKLAYEDNESDEPVAVPQNKLKMIEKTLENAPSKSAAVDSFKVWLAELAKRPVKSLMGPIQDMVKGLGERLGKDVTLVVTGEELLVDPELHGSVVRNLVHVLRNSIDHGIEAPHERGDKPQTGVIRLEFFDKAELWGIKISDDGRGIDPARVKQSAVLKGLITKERAQKMTDREVGELIFAEGFSTAEATTDISGRGVGMGAMRKAVETVGGEFRLVRSTLGKGTEFVASVPKSAIGRKQAA